MASAGAASEARSSLTSALLACGLVAGPLFVLVFTIESATRPGYDPMRMVVSQLALGPGGWVQTLNFLVDGALIVAFSLGLARCWARPEVGPAGRLAPTLLAIVGLGVVGAGIFSVDPGGGYPPLEPVPGLPTLHSQLHDVVSLVVFGGLPLVIATAARHLWRLGDRSWAVYSAVAAAVAALIFASLVVGLNASPVLARLAGAIQRLYIVLAWGWMALLAAKLLRA